MRRQLMLWAAISILIPLHSGLSQTLSDYVKEIRGDTLVVKDYHDMNNQANSLYLALKLDTNSVPAGRVYELKAGGYYPLLNTPNTIRKTVIVGEDQRILVQNNDTASPPPLVCGGTWNGIWNTRGINVRHDLTVKNCIMTPTASIDAVGWCFAYADSPNVHMTFDNCLFEHTRWVFAAVSPTGVNCNTTFRNCYFVNMNGQPCRRSAGTFDSFANADTLLVENCTHIMAAGTLYRFRADPAGNQFKRVIFNHNTFVNCGGYVFMHPGYQDNISLTNNLFVNSNVQSFPAIHSIDTGEQDPDRLPMGLVNVYPDGTQRKLLCQNNLAYWDPSLADMDSILDANHVNGVTNWQSQGIVMNARTDSLFRDDAHYPYLVSDTWKSQMPTFMNPRDLFTTQLVHLRAHAVAIADTNSVDLCPDWRLINTSPDKYLNPDWPIPVDLSYSDPDLLTAGISGLPIGDLNWFPAKKAEWVAQRSAEYSNVQHMLDHGTLDVAAGHPLPSEFRLEQNYPNPFNPVTNIHYTIGGNRVGQPASGLAGEMGNRDVTLIVYDLSGRKVATLVNERKAPGSYEVLFDGSGLASGVYLCRMTAGSIVQSRAMLLLK